MRAYICYMDQRESSSRISLELQTIILHSEL